MDSPLTGIDDRPDLRKYRSKWRNRKEFDKVTEIRKRMDLMRQIRQTTCYWDTADGFVNPEGTRDHGHDWNLHWDKMLRAWLMYREYIPGRSNLKSPISWAPVQAARSEFNDKVVGVIIKANHELDVPKVRILQRAIESLYKKADMDQANNASFTQCAIYGTSIDEVAWVTKKREVDYIITGQDVNTYISKKQRKAKKQLLDENKPLTEKKTIVEYDDIALVPIDIREFYVDPMARCMVGPAFEAVDCIVRQTPSVEQIKALLKASSDPYIIKENIDKIVSAYDAKAMYIDRPFFDFPDDVLDRRKVEYIRYYNKQTDKFEIIINDQILRSGPLPFNHKQLPFVRHTFINFPGQFYGIGIPAVVEPLQAEDETLRNMRMEQLYLELSNPIVASADVYDELEQQWQTSEPRKLIKISGDISENGIRPLRMQQAIANYQEMRDSIGKDAISATGINPIMYALPQNRMAVRNNVMIMEATQKVIKSSIQNWGYGWIDAVKQMLYIMRQKYPDMYDVREDKGNKLKIPKQIRIDGANLTLNEVGDVVEEPIQSSSWFFMEDQYYMLETDPEVALDLDTFVPMTQGNKAQSTENAIQQLVPILANPQVMQTPGIMPLVREYVQTHGLPSTMLDNLQEEDSGQSIADADNENQMILKGQAIVGTPGASDAHKMQHVNLLLQLQDQSQKLNVVNPVQTSQLQQIIMLLTMHLSTDNMPKSASYTAVAGQLQSIGAQQVQQMGVPQGMGQQQGSQNMMQGQSELSQADSTPQPPSPIPQQ